MRSHSPTDNWEFGPKDEAMREALTDLVQTAKLVDAQLEDGGVTASAHTDLAIPSAESYTAE